MRWIRRVKYWLQMRREAEALREELDYHREMLAADYARDGLGDGDAHTAARRAMGNEMFMREESRNVWWSSGLDAFVKDWRYAWRGLRRSPAFAIVAILSLGIGIGANTAIFSVINTLLLAQLPVRNASELVQIKRDIGTRGTDERFSRDEFDALSATGFALSMYTTTDIGYEINGKVERAMLDAVDGNYFTLLGLRSLRGRLISPADNAAGAAVMVVTEEFWRTSLNADTAVIGRTVRLYGQPFSIIGVTPSRFAGLRFPSQTDVMVPVRAATTLGAMRENGPRHMMYNIVGRRAADQSVRMNDALARVWRGCCAAGERLNTTGSSFRQTTSVVTADVSRGIVQPKLDLRKHYTRIFLALMFGVGILLLAACANVANLLVARSQARAGELAVRLALGASRERLVMQLVIESLQLSLLGAVVGVVIASWGTSILSHANVGDLTYLIEPRIAPQVLAFTVVVSLISGIIFGVVPAVRVLGVDLITPLKQGRRRTTTGRRGLLDRGLVAVQLALALLLISGASLLVQTLKNLQTTNSGFDTDGRYEITVETRRTPYEQRRMTAQLVDEILRRVRAVPGVTVASFASIVPIYGGRGVTAGVTLPGASTPDAQEPEIDFAAVTPEYFRSMGMKMRAGNDLPRAVAATTAPTMTDVVVNEQFAAKYFGKRDAINQTFESITNGDSVRNLHRVVGVVAGAKFTNLRANVVPMFFVPIRDGVWPYLVLTIQPASNASAVNRRIVAEISAAAPGINVGDPSPLSSSMANALVRERISAGLATVFGVVALCLVAVGLYGVMLYQVTERTSEIGIRVALGARPMSIASLVIGQSFTVVLIGLFIGVPLALGAGRAVASQLYGVPPISLQALFVGIATLLVVAVAATAVPVYRATGIDPIEALRAE